MRRWKFKKNKKTEKISMPMTKKKQLLQKASQKMTLREIKKTLNYNWL